jgi:D-alanine-D-alanine ligase
MYGGRSAEHEVSLRSAHSVYEALVSANYEVLLVYVSPQGTWFIRYDDSHPFVLREPGGSDQHVIFSHDPRHKGFVPARPDQEFGLQPVDCVFPVLHGTYGEDGTIQGLLEVADIPYVGCGVLASAAGMDKVIMKTAFKEAGLEVGPFFWFLRSEWVEQRETILERLRLANFPLFVKPANLGSSVGISKVQDPSGFEAAVELAARFDRKVVVEDGIAGRELEVSVLGNERPVASLPGEVVPQADFYDYEEKYLRDTAELIMPADVPDDVNTRAAAVATAAFKAIDGSGLARVDMFLTPDNRLIVNEINTMPGFTNISMYPKLWQVTGVSYRDLVDRLIELAMERYAEKGTIVTDRGSL